MKFTQTWFETTAKLNFEKYLAEFKDKPVNFLEIGCFEGRATVWMLENILTDPDARIEVIDTFGGSSEHRDFKMDLSNLYDTFLDNVRPFGNRVVTHRGESQNIIRQLSDRNFDFVYVDGSHQAPDVLEDAVLSFRLLKPDGIMIFDDFKWAKYDDKHMNPGMGIDAFLSVFANKLEVLLKDYQCVIKKK